MSSMLKLIHNEQLKIYTKKSTWLMYLILAGLIFTFAFSVNYYGVPNEEYQVDNWQQVLQEENQNLEQEMKKDKFKTAYHSYIIEKNNYYLEHDIQPAAYDAWNFTGETSEIIIVVGLLSIIVAGGIVANEFRWGTIKLLLIRPIERSKILFSKYVAVLLFALYTLLFLFITAWITGAIFFGISEVDATIVKDATDGFRSVPLFKDILTNYSFPLVDLLMMTTLAFMISTVFRNSSLAIGVSLFLLMGGSSFVQMFADKDWVKYILFANTNLRQYTAGNTPFAEGMTLGFSLTVLIVYYVIFIVTSWIVFKKRDVAGQ
ncbi:ABC-2 type transport system permease protein [Virgibacillus chiguensis]|uniref:ABC-2 type transport system permease protein n=2 Tax=Virgibacillus chiguensis TaxID=411959 RepID=A0A1M5SWC2_9BACI|nr:ABC transporter permease [Virgibacillus chiguensis]SHH42785.1 ABC-2 type transport system permease protein [Virgibacillus chiguensis]